MKKYRYKARIKPVFEIDITTWNDENEPKSKMCKRLKEELADYSVFMQNHISSYENLVDIDVEIIKEERDE